jgi:hypothetical protein
VLERDDELARHRLATPHLRHQRADDVDVGRTYEWAKLDSRSACRSAGQLPSFLAGVHRGAV